MSFYDRLLALEAEPLGETLARVTAADVERALAAPGLDVAGFLALLSPAAEAQLERMAQRAHRLTVQHFGKVILLFTPLYLANYCSNACRYCGFAAGNRIPRHQLSLDEVEAEARLIRATGLRHLLILTGDSRARSSVDYLRQCVAVLAGYFDSMAIEVYALEAGEYRALIAAGVDGLTIHQETYDRDLYAELHPGGPKRDFRYRLEAPDRACEAGVRGVNLGALLGLAEWRRDAFLTGLHADYLQHRFPAVEVGLSLPRMRPHEGVFQPEHEVTDREFVQILLATRLFLPGVGLTLSTRESAEFRDHLIPLGITKMSAASCTAVGGRLHPDEDPGQFEIADARGVPSVEQAIAARGYKAIFKDWHPVTSPATGAVTGGMR